MGAVHVGVGHDENFVVPHLADVELVPDAGAQGRDHRHQLVVAVDAVGAGLLDVEHLAPQRQDGLDVGVPAHLGRAACRIALHDEQFGLAGVLLVAVGQFAGHAVGFQRALAAYQVPGLLGGGAGAGRLGGLLQNGLGGGGVFLKELAQGLVDEVAHQALDEGVAQLGLGLALELGFLQFDADDRDDALARVGAGEVLVLVFEDALGAGVLVEGAGQRQLEALLMGAALGGVHVVGEAQQQLVVAVVVVLQGHLGHGALALALHIDDLGGQGGQVPAFAQVADEGADAALIAHGFPAFFGLVLFLGRAVRYRALVGEGDAHPAVEEGFFPQALEQHVVAVFGGLLEHDRVGLEGDGGAGGGRGADLFQVAVRLAALEALLVLGAVAAYPHHQPFRQGVDHGCTYAVQAAGHLVAGIFAAELAAGVQHGVHNGDSRNAQLGLVFHGDAAAVVRHFDDVAGLDGHLDVGAVPGQGLVNGVVHDLIHQMVQARGTGGTDIHAGAFAHGLQPFQDLDLRAAVGMVGGCLTVGFGDDLFCHGILSSLSVLSLQRKDQRNSDGSPVQGQGGVVPRRAPSATGVTGRLPWGVGAARDLPVLPSPLNLSGNAPPVF